MRYLIQQWIEALQAKDQCPRLMIDATVEGVVVPEHVSRQWGQAMPIDLDPGYPLALCIDDRGIACRLSFGGPQDCYFPWNAIYVVQDRATQIGIVIEENLPSGFKLADGTPPAEGSEASEQGMLRAAASQPQMRIVPPGRVSDAVAPGSERSGATPTARRATFKVLEGGKKS